MGAGKTSVGKRLAARLGWEFADSDHEIERRTGAPIPVIFEHEGEAGFRRRERAMIDELTQEDRVVLATGGGAVLDPDNRAHLRDRGYVVYLQCTVDRQLARTRRDTNRPLLQVADPRARLESLMQQRDPLYREVARVVVDTERRPLKAIVEDIVKQYTATAGTGERAG